MEYKHGEFRRRVYEIVAMVPRGKVVTYGQVALLAGIPRAAREVGWIAHAGPSNLPWQRVVNRFGGLAKGYHGGQLGHKADLEKDGVAVHQDLTVALARYQWVPDQESVQKLGLPDDLARELNTKIPFTKERLSPQHRRQ